MFTFSAFWEQHFWNYLQCNLRQQGKYQYKVQGRKQQNSVLKVFINNEH